MAARSFLENLGPNTRVQIIQARADDLGAQSIGDRLQRLGIGNPEEGIVVFAETDALTLEFAGDEGVTVDPVADWEGEKGAHAQDHGAEHFIANVKVIVGIGGPAPFEDAVMRIIGRVVPRQNLIRAKNGLITLLPGEHFDHDGRLEPRILARSA